MCRINVASLSREQLKADIIGERLDEIDSRCDWTDVWPLVDRHGVVDAVLDSDGYDLASQSQLDALVVFDEANDCYRWASECCAICDAAGQVTVATTERDGRPLCEACAAEVDGDGQTPIHWWSLRLFDCDNHDIDDEEKITAALNEFRRTGAMCGIFFHRVGLLHEDPEDASTWGPESPEAVDWTGFPDDAR